MESCAYLSPYQQHAEFLVGMNFHQKVITASDWIVPGYDAYSQAKFDPGSPTNLSFTGGMHVEMLNYLRDALNFTVSAVLAPPIRYIPGNETGILPMHRLGGFAEGLNQGSIDVAIGPNTVLIERVTGPDALKFLHTINTPRYLVNLLS